MNKLLDLRIFYIADKIFFKLFYSCKLFKFVNQYFKIPLKLKPKSIYFYVKLNSLFD